MLSEMRVKMVVVQKISRLNPYQAVLDAERVPLCSIMLTAVPGAENTMWRKYVPSGQFELTIDNPEAYGAFELGRTYLVDFTVAP